MNYTNNQNSLENSKFLTQKRRRIMSDSSFYTETSNNEEYLTPVIKPSTKYAEIPVGFKIYNTMQNNQNKININSINNDEKINSTSMIVKNENKSQVQIRKMSNNSAEGKMSCNCKNSQCLKLYCECFSAMLYCDPKICSCKNCINNTENEVK
jgi:hypothetical protein